MDGTVTTFDVPGASQVTYAYSINPAGVIAGSYQDASYAHHAFVRAVDGTITTFDVRGMGTGPSQGADEYSINPAGAITGTYFDSNFGQHGFIWK